MKDDTKEYITKIIKKTLGKTLRPTSIKVEECDNSILVNFDAHHCFRKYSSCVDMGAFEEQLDKLENALLKKYDSVEACGSTISGISVEIFKRT